MNRNFDEIHIMCASLSGVLIGYFLGVNVPDILTPNESGDLATWVQTLFVIASIIITAASILHERAIRNEAEINAERISAKTLYSLASEIHSEIVEIDNLIEDYKEKQSDSEYMSNLSETEIANLSTSKNHEFIKIMERLASIEDGAPIQDFIENSKTLRSHLKENRLISLLELHNSASRLRSKILKISPGKLNINTYYDIKVGPELSATKQKAQILVSSLKKIIDHK